MQRLELGWRTFFEPRTVIVDFLNRVAETIPVWKAGGFLIFTAVNVWLLTRLDKDSRRYVELRRQWWGGNVYIRE
jgi:hypothetical protein